MKPEISLVLVLAGTMLLTAGCIGLGTSPSQQINQTDPQDPTPNGSLSVNVTDENLDPIPQAKVQLVTDAEDHEATAGPAGQAHFPSLPPGPATVHASADGYQAQQRSTTIPENGTTHLSIELETTSTTPHVQRFEFNGFFECSATYLIITGDCFAPARAATEELGTGPEINATNHRFVFPFTVQEGWETITLEQRWDDGEFTVGSIMRINLEPVEEGPEGHSPHFARSEGASPLEATVQKDEPHPTASEEELTIPEGPVELRTRTFHLGVEETHQPAGTSFLGAGAAIQQPFTVLIEVQYS